MRKILIFISIIFFFSCDSEPKEVYGCISSTAYNFNPDANIYDDSCCYLSGCMDSTAYNFDVEKFTHMTFKLTQMYNSTYEKYVEISIDNQKALKSLVCRHD